MCLRIAALCVLVALEATCDDSTSAGLGRLPRQPLETSSSNRVPRLSLTNPHHPIMLPLPASLPTLLDHHVPTTARRAAAVVLGC
jgi:hypothetical protein